VGAAERDVAQAPPEQRASTVVLDFRVFFKEKLPLMTKMGVAYGASLQDSEDAAQEILIALHNRWCSDRWPDANDAYLRASMRNEILKRWERDQNRIIKLISKSEVTPESAIQCEMEERECEEWMRQHLAGLPEAQRLVMSCFYDGESYQEIAAKFGKTEAAVRQAICAARGRLKAEWAQEMFEAHGVVVSGFTQQARKENR
jgi:RNA polymerase sigma factor (sigma-70 family)